MSKNLGTNFNHRVTLRLNDDQYNFLFDFSEIMGVTPSEYMRMVINTGLVASDGDVNNLLNNVLKGEVGTNENVKTGIDH